MAKELLAVRADEALIAVIDEIAELTGRTRTDVVVSALERGLVDEQAFLRAQQVPFVRDLALKAAQSPLVDKLLKAFGQQVDQERLAVAEKMKANRRLGKAAKVAKAGGGD